MCLASVCSDWCMSGGLSCRMLFMGLFVRYLPVSVVCMCLMFVIWGGGGGIVFSMFM